MFESIRARLSRVVFACVTATAAAAASAAPEAAKSAEAFIDSIGVNTHYGNAGNVGNAYGNATLDLKLRDLGVRHIRDHTWSDIGLTRVDALYSTYGIRANLILGETTRSPATLVNILKTHPAYEAIEGLNEPDFSPRTYNGFTDVPASNDFSATRAFQNDLYAAFKADPQTSNIPVLSPAMGRSNRSHQLIPINFDIAAMHNYPWAAGTPSHMPSAGLDTALTDMAALRGTKPLWVTETGYFNRAPASETRGVPESVSAKYIPRLLGEYFNSPRNIPRTYLYELVDQGSTTAREENFGLLRFDMSEKPAYVALKNLIQLFKEPEAGTFTADSLDYTITGAGDLSKVHHTLLQKSNGTFYLMLWQEVANWDRPTLTESVAAPMAVTLNLNEPIGQARTYLTNQSLTPTGTFFNPTSINLNVLDQMLVVELSPVPEPGTAVVGLIVGTILLARRRSRVA